MKIYHWTVYFETGDSYPAYAASIRDAIIIGAAKQIEAGKSLCFDRIRNHDTGELEFLDSDTLKVNL